MGNQRSQARPDLVSAATDKRMLLDHPAGLSDLSDYSAMGCPAASA
jgi:hypothetical protein